MIKIDDLLKIADAYKTHYGLQDVTVSYRVFQDSKKIALLRDGADITVGRFNDAILWFSTNWPEGCVWPDVVHRPYVSPKGSEPATSPVASAGA